MGVTLRLLPVCLLLLLVSHLAFAENGECIDSDLLAEALSRKALALGECDESLQQLKDSSAELQNRLTDALEKGEQVR
jgi:hypothetical protein